MMKRKKGGTEELIMLRIVICDDDLHMLNKMKNIVEAALAGVHTKAKIQTFSDAQQISRDTLARCDIALLDIDFENASYNGMDIARQLRKFQNDAIIIFATNFIEYAPEGYEVKAFRYVLKRDLEEDLKTALQLALQQRNKDTLQVQCDRELIELPLDDILYLEVQQHSVTAFVRDFASAEGWKTYSFYASLSALEEKLEPQGFLRIHKSYLVNMRYIKKYQCREMTLEGGFTLRVGEKAYATNKKKYLLWKGWH